MGNSYAGCLSYADDLSLLSPTKKGLQKLVDLCEEYAKENDILFNGNKSQFLIFKGRGNSPKDCHVNVNGSRVWNEEQATHLGHCLSTNDPDSSVGGANAHFWRSFNIFRSDFGHINSTLQCRLFKQYCCSFYGSPLWYFMSNGFRNICISWRKALRKIWKISNRTHCNLVAMLSDSDPLEKRLVQIFKKFSDKALMYGSRLLKSTIQMACLNPTSVYCNNVNEAEQILDIYNNEDNELQCTVDILRDLLDIRDGMKVCDMLSKDEIGQMIDVLCIS